MKQVIITMALFFIYIITYAGNIIYYIKTSAYSGEVPIYATYIFPIYGGMVVISGILVGCTYLVIRKIHALEQKVSQCKPENEESGKVQES